MVLLNVTVLRVLRHPLGELLALSLLGVALALPAAGADPVQREVPTLQAAPGSMSDEDVEAYWVEASAIESTVFADDSGNPDNAIAQLERATFLFKRVAEERDGDANAYWRAARSRWLEGELLPLGETDAKLIRFEDALSLADLGLANDPNCAECMLWKFICMGRLRTTLGMWDGLKAVPEMAELLDRGIELNPTHRDGPDNSTLGNLHYSSAIFYRILPDWFWIKWMIGVRGDKERALEHSRKALALHPDRIDYKIEVATQLLCIGSADGDKEKLEEGRRQLSGLIDYQATNEDERREIFFAKQMLDHPEKSCGYSGDALLDVDEDEARGETAEEDSAPSRRRKRGMKK